MTSSSQLRIEGRRQCYWSLAELLPFLPSSLRRIYYRTCDQELQDLLTPLWAWLRHPQDLLSRLEGLLFHRTWLHFPFDPLSPW